MTRHVVMWSGGITSWATARHVITQHGTENTTLLFADTNAEEDDLHRFNREASAQLGAQVVRVADPQERDPMQVFEDARWIGNTRIAQCSYELKQLPARRWLEANCTPADTVIYLGIDWSETHRLPSIVRAHSHPIEGCDKPAWCRGLFRDNAGTVERLAGPGCKQLLPAAASWTVDFPLTRPPYSDKRSLLEEVEALGIRRPQLYTKGFPHANCAGACVKGGVAQWELLYRVDRPRFDKWLAFEARMQRKLGADRAILRDRTGGTTKPLSLAALAARIEEQRERQPSLLDISPVGGDWGGCGCFTDAA
jgi:hypothetical protein